MNFCNEFVKESNKIEGIVRNSHDLDQEVAAFRRFLNRRKICIFDLKAFVHECEPGAQLREHPNMNVTVGKYLPPAGGPLVGFLLEDLLQRCNKNKHSPRAAYFAHHEFEKIHPFTDCNGRVGRMLWYWMMSEKFDLGFLHTFYYQTLKYGRPT